MKFQIEGEMLHNKKLKEKILALQEDIEKTVSIVTVVLKCLYNIAAVLAAYSMCVLIVHWVERGT